MIYESSQLAMSLRRCLIRCAGVWRCTVTIYHVFIQLGTITGGSVWKTCQSSWFRLGVENEWWICQLCVTHVVYPVRPFGYMCNVNSKITSRLTVGQGTVNRSLTATSEKRFYVFIFITQTYSFLHCSLRVSPLSSTCVCQPAALLLTQARLASLWLQRGDKRPPQACLINAVVGGCAVSTR